MKTGKTYAAVMLAAGLLSLLGVVPALADTEGFSEEYYRFQNPDGILSGDEAEQLNEKLDEISHKQNFDVTAALVDSLNGESVEAYADDLYDTCNFGYGEDRDGVLLLVSLEDHDWYISTSGYGITVFTDAGIQYIGEQIRPQLADGDYLEAFENYIDLCDQPGRERNGLRCGPYAEKVAVSNLAWPFFGGRFWRRPAGSRQHEAPAEIRWHAAGSQELHPAGQHAGDNPRRLFPLPDHP